MERATTAEILLALRSPSSSWLAVLASVIDEANHDPQFDAHQRQLVAQLLGEEHLPAPLIKAARERMYDFESDLEALTQPGPQPVAAQRPKLTLVGQ
ncbi:MAG TPA: hypothetical protein VF271_06095 [Rhodanobacteraceae bacterium]